MNVRLEAIQKSLDMYLETKKVIFPRFYFISNDQLLEILGLSKNPMKIQDFFKDLFDSIVSLKMQKAPTGSKIEALSMFSEDGEEVPFTGALTLEGPVEVSKRFISKISLFVSFKKKTGVRLRDGSAMWRPQCEAL